MLTGRLIALDIETTGLDPFHDKILLIQLGTRTKRLVIDCRKLGNEIQRLNILLANDRFGKLGHNLAFDCAFLEVNGLRVRDLLSIPFSDRKSTPLVCPNEKA